MMNKIRCQIVDCKTEVPAEEITYMKFYKVDGKTPDGHRPVCSKCLKKLANYKKKLTTKFIYG